MKKRIAVIVATMVIAGLFGASLVLAAPAANKASGGGTVDWSGVRVTYGFTAQVDADGNVKGQAQFHHRDSGISNHVAINCLAVAGDDAWLGGTVTESTNPTVVGLEIVWRVQDNGQGKAAPPDATSAVVGGVVPGECNNMLDLSLEPWTNGNVQVK